MRTEDQGLSCGNLLNPWYSALKRSAGAKRMIVAYGERKIERGKEEAFEALWARMQDAAGRQPGFIAARLLKSENHGGVYATVEYWEDQERQKEAYGTDELRAIAAELFTGRMTRQAPITEYCAVVGSLGEVPAH